MNFKEASAWASEHLGKKVTPSNISYLVQYGRVTKRQENGGTRVDRFELQDYYARHSISKEDQWKQKLGDDLNWRLSFSEYKEFETTKHVHRLHPYKGKFIPQLVEYFLDDHTDQFKRQRYFSAGDIILDPFCGSGTTLVQSCELGMHAIGIDISEFNAFISNAKVASHDISRLKTHAQEISDKLIVFQKQNNNVEFENHLLAELKEFNNEFFPSPQFKRQVRQKEIDEMSYAIEKSNQFQKTYHRLVKKYNIELKQDADENFLDHWFLKPVRDEIDFVFAEIKKVSDKKTKKILALILSRTVRSCRATTHADLGTLKESVSEAYYCKKHGKICKPIFSISSWWNRYTQDTMMRLAEFDRCRTDTRQHCLVGDGRNIDIEQQLRRKKSALAELVKEDKIAGIFSSPPYVGLIDYHEQHAYAYDLLGFTRKDELEIGPLYKGQGAAARQSYVEGVSAVLNNCRRFMKPDYDVFLVANDKYNLYPTIARNANMQIVNKYKRPVLNRVEKDRSSYAEIIFHLKEL